MNKHKIDSLIGKKYGQLTVISREPNDKNSCTVWRCVCTCGSCINVGRGRLVGGTKSHCGCNSRNHGEGIGKQTKEYRTWGGMKNRCRNPKCKKYHNYGGRGIKVCDRWKSYKNFLSDMGRAPSPKHSIDRIDVNGDYEPKNCRWATQKEQANNTTTNKLVDFKGETKTVSEWCAQFGLDSNRIYQRLTTYNWPVEKAFTAPHSGGHSKITLEQARNVKGLLSLGLSVKLISKCRLIDQFVIYPIKSGKTWRHA